MSSGRTAIPPIPTGTADRFEGNPAGAGEKPRALDAQGSIGKQFTENGAIGSVGEAVGGPLASDGMIGKQFTAGGSVGGTVQSAMGGTKKQ